MNPLHNRHAGRQRWRHRDDKGQQALLLVMAVALIMFTFAFVLVNESTAELPIVNKTLIDHAAYRALALRCVGQRSRVEEGHDLVVGAVHQQHVVQGDLAGAQLDRHGPGRIAKVPTGSPGQLW